MTASCDHSPYKSLPGGVIGSGASQTFLENCAFNVRLALVTTALYSIVEALYQSSGVLDSFLYMVGNDSNTAVGFAESISGMTILVMAFPAGYVADRFSRAKMIRWGSMFDWFVVGWYIYAVWSGSMLNLYIAMFLMGLFDTLFGTCSYSLLADSIPQGERSIWMTRMAIVASAGAAIGPMANLVLFYFLGDQWDIGNLKIVLTAALCLCIPLSIMNMFYRDIYVSQEDEDTVDEIKKADLVVEQLRAGYGWMVPYIVCFNDLATSIGAGMTVKFFPLFFRNDYGFSPSDLQWLATGYMIGDLIFTVLCEKVGRYMGRVHATIVFSFGGVLCLFGLAWVRWLPVVVLVYLIRGSVQNAVYPTDRAIIMDFVPSSQRGRWNAIESVASFSWSGSAVLGGYLMDHHDYRYAFVFTAYIYLVALVIRIPLLWLVPRYEDLQKNKDAEGVHKSPLMSPLDRSPLAPHR